jgi:hypothetical protein
MITVGPDDGFLFVPEITHYMKERDERGSNHSFGAPCQLGKVSGVSDLKSIRNRLGDGFEDHAKHSMVILPSTTSHKSWVQDTHLHVATTQPQSTVSYFYLSDMSSD